MILLPVFLKLIIWVILAVVICAWPRLPPGIKCWKPANLIFLCGGVFLPLAGWPLLQLACRSRVEN